MPLSDSQLSAVQSKIQSDPVLLGLDDNYPSIVAILQAPTTIQNPVNPAPKVPDLPEFRELLNLVMIAAPQEYTNLARIKVFEDWVIDRCDGDLVITDDDFAQASPSVADFNAWATAKFVGILANTVVITALELAQITNTFALRSWARRQLVGSSTVTDASPETKLSLVLLQSALPSDTWLDTATEVIRYCLDNLLTVLPRIDGQPILGQDGRVVTTLSLLGSVFLAEEVISQTTFDAMAALLMQTKDDPTWTPEVPGPSWAVANGIPFLNSPDVQQAVESL